MRTSDVGGDGMQGPALGDDEADHDFRNSGELDAIRAGPHLQTESLLGLRFLAEHITRVLQPKQVI